MATLASLVVDLRTNSQRFVDGMNKATSRLDKFGKTTATVSRAFNIFAGGFAAFQATRFINSTLEAGDKIQKLSIRLGASTEALSQYQHVADLSGIRFETFTMALQRMTRRVAEAAVGTGEARGALRELGVDAQRLTALKPEEQFELLADAMNRISSQSDKVRLAMKLFDSEGVSVLQTMEGGADAIRRMRMEADRLGLTLSKDQADQMAKARDAITRLSASANGLANTLAIQLVPYIEVLTRWLGEGLPRATQGATATILTLTRILANAGASMAELIVSSRQLELELLDNQAGEILSQIGLVQDPDETRKQVREWQERAVALREIASNAQSALVPIIDKLNTPIEVMPGSPLALLTGNMGVALSDTLSSASAQISAFNDAHVQAYLEHTQLIQSIEANHQATLTGFRLSAADQAVGFLRLIGTKSKAFALAAIAAEKAIAITRVRIQAEVAAMAALTPPPIGLGPVAGQGLAAKIRLTAGLSQALIVGQGIAQAIQLNQTQDSLSSNLAFGTPGNTPGGSGNFGPLGTNFTGLGQRDINIVVNVGGEQFEHSVSGAMLAAMDKDQIVLETSQGLERVRVVR